ncbi:MAG: Amuc_1099 family pilus-like system protein [bacterium]
MVLKINPNLPFLRQYDKLIAVVVLIFLLISLFYLTHAGVARQQEESTYILQLDGLKPKSESLPPMDLAEYEASVRLAHTPVQLEAPKAQQAGFLVPECRVTCTNALCQKPIPYAAAKCPFCDTAQPTPPEFDPGLDSDKDGIPDKVEVALGLNPQDPADAKGDLDKDGFNNLEELLAKTDPKDAQSHPTLDNLLRVKELRGKPLPLIFSGVNKMPDGKLQLVFNQTGANARTFWVKTGDLIGDTGYVVGKVDVKFEERVDSNMSQSRVEVSTVVVIRQSDNKEVLLRINEGGKNTDVEAVIVLPLDNTTYKVLENGTFKVRDETYRVVSVDNGTTSVVIKNEAGGQEKVIRKLD